MTDSLQISELFYSIQGESTRAGLPCAFIRLSGCNLRCLYCDSRYTWDEPGTAMSVDEVAAWAKEYPGVMVEITGGEPLLQEAVYPLMELLTEGRREVLLESSGSLSIAQVPDRVGVILDLKCPDSGMADHNEWSNIGLLRTRREAGSRDEIKFVLSSEQDFTWAKDIVDKYQLTDIVPVLFSPVRNALAPDLLARLILEAHLPVRLQLQLHTRLWPDVSRGV